MVLAVACSQVLGTKDAVAAVVGTAKGPWEVGKDLEPAQKVFRGWPEPAERSVALAVMHFVEEQATRPHSVLVRLSQHLREMARYAVAAELLAHRYLEQRLQ